MLNIIKYKLFKLADNLLEADADAAVKLAIRAKEREAWEAARAEEREASEEEASIVCSPSCTKSYPDLH